MAKKNESVIRVRDVVVGFDGVTVQWFEDMDAYRAHMEEPDFPEIWADISNFLDTDKLHFIVTEQLVTVKAGDFK